MIWFPHRVSQPKDALRVSSELTKRVNYSEYQESKSWEKFRMSEMAQQGKDFQIR